MTIMASFGDYFYILAGVIWLAFSIYKGQSKKTSSKTGKKSSISMIDEWLDSMAGSNDASPISKPHPYSAANTASSNDDLIGDAWKETEETVEVKAPRVFSYDDAVEESNEIETFAVYTKTDQNRELDSEGNKIKGAQYQINRKKNRVDLRKAVIYSEIINPKYF